MDKEVDTTAVSEGTYDLSDLTREIAEQLDAEIQEEPKAEDKPKRGRPKKEVSEKKEAVVPDITETEEVPEETQEAEEAQEASDQGDGTISIEDIPDDQRVEAASAIIDILSPEQRDALMDKFGEGISGELKKLRDEKAALEQKVQDIEKQSRSRIDKIISPNSFFADVVTESDLDEKEEKIRANLNYYDGLIDSTDELFEIGGKEYTREQIRNFRNIYRKHAEEATSHRYRIRETAKYRERFNENTAKLSSKYDWYDDETSDKRKLYNSLINDIDLDHLRYVSPKSAALLPEIIAKYVSSDEKEEGARRIFKLPIKQAKPKNIRIASGGGIIQGEKDVVSETNRKAQTGELTMEDFTKAIAASL